MSILYIVLRFQFWGRVKMRYWLSLFRFIKEFLGTRLRAIIAAIISMRLMVVFSVIGMRPAFFSRIEWSGFLMINAQ